MSTVDTDRTGMTNSGTAGRKAGEPRGERRGDKLAGVERRGGKLAGVERRGGRDASDDPGDLVALLHARGQRVTPQRLGILRELRRRGRHATAEEIHRAVHDELRGTSTPTVYATLDLFVELGLARRIDTGTAAVYDARLDPHQHAVCRRCGRVQDVDGTINADALLRAAHEAGFSPQGAELIISGLCAECAAGRAERS